MPTYDEIAELLAFGKPMGVTWPPRPPRPLPHKDAREYALERLRTFISLLVFRRTMETSRPAQGFRLKEPRIHIYQPDDVHDLTPPAMAFLPGRGFHEPLGLGPPLPIEGTIDKYGQGTVLVWQSDYTELFTIEVFSAKHAIRRAIVAGLKTVLRANETSLSTDLLLPEYFDQVARFWLNESTYLDNPEVVKNRRTAHLFVELVVPEVFLIDYVTLTSIIDLGGPDANEVYDGNVFLDFGETPVDPSILRSRCAEDDS